MHNVTFNKIEKTATCLHCKTNPVPLEAWNKPCDECKKKRAAFIVKTGIHVAKRDPAAVIYPDGAPQTQVYVDKYGKEVDNPGYDLQNDPRGWNYTGTKKKGRTMI